MPCDGHERPPDSKRWKFHGDLALPLERRLSRLLRHDLDKLSDRDGIPKWKPVVFQSRRLGGMALMGDVMDYLSVGREEVLDVIRNSHHNEEPRFWQFEDRAGTWIGAWKGHKTCLGGFAYVTDSRLVQALRCRSGPKSTPYCTTPRLCSHLQRFMRRANDDPAQ